MASSPVQNSGAGNTFTQWLQGVTAVNGQPFAGTQKAFAGLSSAAQQALQNNYLTFGGTVGGIQASGQQPINHYPDGSYSSAVPLAAAQPTPSSGSTVAPSVAQTDTTPTATADALAAQPMVSQSPAQPFGAPVPNGTVSDSSGVLFADATGTAQLGNDATAPLVTATPDTTTSAFPWGLALIGAGGILLIFLVMRMVGGKRG